MNYEIKNTNINVGYNPGQYLIDGECLYQVIYDEDKGYALLDAYHGVVSTDFYETVEDFKLFTTISSMKFVKQENRTIFTIQS